nr:hypothetical protein [uncultured Cohaesibacter sp.]
MFKSSHILTSLQNQTLVGWRDIWFLALGFCLTALGVIAVGVFAGWYEPFCSLSGKTGTLPTGACFREWTGALSGWVAAFGAFMVGLPSVYWLKAQTQLAPTERQIARLSKSLEYFKTEASDELLKIDLCILLERFQPRQIEQLAKSVEKFSTEIRSASALVDIEKCIIANWLQSSADLARQAEEIRNFVIIGYDKDGIPEKEFDRSMLQEFTITISCLHTDMANLIKPIFSALQEEENRLKTWVTRHSIPEK